MFQISHYLSSDIKTPPVEIQNLNTTPTSTDLARDVAAMHAEGAPAEEADAFLAARGYFAVHDAGAERHLLVFRDEESRRPTGGPSGGTGS